jgi:hypothetical protein
MGSVIGSHDGPAMKDTSATAALFIDGANLHLTARALGFDIEEGSFPGAPERKKQLGKSARQGWDGSDGRFPLLVLGETGTLGAPVRSHRSFLT